MTALNSLEKNNGKIIQFPVKNYSKKIYKIVKRKRKARGFRTIGAATFLSPEKINEVLSFILEDKKNGRRDCAILVVGFNSALRGGDILNLKLSDVFDEDGYFKSHVLIREGKTKKPKKFLINDVMKRAIALYIDNDRKNFKEDLSQPLFISRQKDKNGNARPITIHRLNQILKKVKERIYIDGKFSSHSCRKSFARNAYDSSKNKGHMMVLLQEALNHSTPALTRSYLCLSEAELDQISTDNQFGDILLQK